MENQDFLDEILEINKLLEEIDKKPNEIKKISLADFENIFVDYFVGNKKLADNPRIMQVWVEKVCDGNILNEVHVVDLRGNTLFIVPKLLETSILNPSIVRKTNFGEIVKLMELQKKLSPTKARLDFLNQSNEHILKAMEKSSDYKLNKERWGFIIGKYKKQDIKKQDTKKEILNEEEFGEWE